MQSHFCPARLAEACRQALSVLVKVPRALALLLIQGYQYGISPLFPGCCRFYPSCSAYAREAVSLHGFCRGCFLTGKRLLRCHPWHAGGEDFVPRPRVKQKQAGGVPNPGTYDRIDSR
ncbi:MAG: membrane protein insertion efficiency factor YidD [Kistimonas sp.]|nr:membrane protein insertion efficiency factor YidD [Kistimonas sp.]